MGQLGDDPDSKAMLGLIASTAEIGRSLATAPQVPAERVKLLRQAFQEMVVDPAFQATAQQRNAPLAPASGEEIQKIIEDTINTPTPIIERVKKIVVMDR